jgi:hypothetical protein
LLAKAPVYFTETTVYFTETSVFFSETSVPEVETPVFFGETTVAVNAAAVLNLAREGFTTFWRAGGVDCGNALEETAC